MMTMISLVLFSLVFIRFIVLAFKAKWSMFEIAAYLVYVPGIMLLMIFGGSVYIALTLIVLAGILSFLPFKEKSDDNMAPALDTAK